jgi:hypothetical protein
MQTTADLAEYDAVPVELEQRCSALTMLKLVRRRADAVHGTKLPALGTGERHGRSEAHWVPPSGAHAAALPPSGRPRLGEPGDADLIEARDLVATALRRVAPLKSAITRVQVQCAQDRRALRALLPAVRRRLSAEQQWAGLWPLMRRVEQLLAS